MIRIIRSLINYYQMIQNKSKNIVSSEKTLLIEGVSRKIKKRFEAIVEQFEEQGRRRKEETRDDYQKLCRHIEQMSIVVNSCYSLYLGDQNSLCVNNRNPFLLLKYGQVFLQNLLQMRKSEMEQKRLKKIENSDLMATYNQNNIYQLVAKKNIEFLQLQNQIKQLKNQLNLVTHRSMIAEEMTKKVKDEADEMLRVYRQNFVKVSDLLKTAEQKESQLLQSNRYLNQQIQTMNLQFEIYKKNYKVKNTPKENEKRVKQRLEKQYENKLNLITKQIQYRYKKQQNIK